MRPLHPSLVFAIVGFVLASAACAGASQSSAAQAATTGADSITVRYGVLGAPRSGSDQCGSADTEVRVDLHTWHTSVATCARRNGATFATLDIQASKDLSASEQAQVQGELDKLTVAGLPSSCVYDGPAWSLSTTRSGAKGEEYWDQDYNCQHRTDIRYVGAPLRPLDALVKSLVGK